MLFAALKLEKDKKKKNIDQVFAYGQCVKAEQRARVGKWVCQVSTWLARTCTPGNYGLTVRSHYQIDLLTVARSRKGHRSGEYCDGFFGDVSDERSGLHEQ